MTVLFEIFKLYGWWGLLGIVICIVLFLMSKHISKKITKDVTNGLDKVGENLVNKMSEQNDKLTNTIIDQQKQLVDYIIKKDISRQENHNVMLNEKMELSEEINMTLKDIMNIHNAQRAFVLSFHNSGENLSGIPFPRYSCFYEWFDKGLSPLQFKCRNLSISSLSHVVNELKQAENQQVIYNIDDLQQNSPSLYALLKEDLSETIIYTGMYDKNNMLVGLFVLEYKKENSIDHLNLNQLHIQVAELTSILNLRYKYTK